MPIARVLTEERVESIKVSIGGIRRLHAVSMSPFGMAEMTHSRIATLSGRC